MKNQKIPPDDQWPAEIPQITPDILDKAANPKDAVWWLKISYDPADLGSDDEFYMENIDLDRYELPPDEILQNELPPDDQWPAEILQIARDIRDKAANPKGAGRFLEVFYDPADLGGNEGPNLENNDLELYDLSPNEILEIASEIREQTAKPDDARQILEHFCDLHDLWLTNRLNDDQSSQFKILLQHLRDSLHNYLSGNRKTLESALGLKRKKARPKADPEIRIDMAYEVLILRLTKMSHQDALREVSEKFGWGITVISEAWATHKFDVLAKMRFERSANSRPWKPDEFKRLKEIFCKKPRVITSEKSRTKPE